MFRTTKLLRAEIERLQRANSVLLDRLMARDYAQYQSFTPEHFTPSAPRPRILRDPITGLSESFEPALTDVDPEHDSEEFEWIR